MNQPKTIIPCTLPQHQARRGWRCEGVLLVLRGEGVGLFCAGANAGAGMPRKGMGSITENDLGYVGCWDDVTGAPMVESLLRVAWGRMC